MAKLTKYYTFDRYELLQHAASKGNIDDACAVIQRAIGQTDGGVAAIFFSDDEKVAEFENTTDPRERSLLMAEYLDLEYAIDRTS